MVLHWTTTTLTAAVASLAAPLPFNGPIAGTVGVFAAAAIGLIGYATTPTPTRKGRRS